MSNKSVYGDNIFLTLLSLLHLVGLSLGSDHDERLRESSDPWFGLTASWQPSSKKSRLAGGDEQDEGNSSTQSSSSSHDHDEMIDDVTNTPELPDPLAPPHYLINDDSSRDPTGLQELMVPSPVASRSPAGLCALRTGQPFSRKAFVNSQARSNGIRPSKAVSFEAATADRVGPQVNIAAEISPEVSAVRRRSSVQDSSLTEDARNIGSQSQSSLIGEPLSKRLATHSDDFNYDYMSSDQDYMSSDNIGMDHDQSEDESSNKYVEQDPSHNYLPQQSFRPVREDPPLLRTLKESDLIGVGFVRASTVRGSSRSQMLPAPVLEHLHESDWNKFTKAFNTYRTQGGERTLYECLSEGIHERIISYLLHHRYAVSPDLSLFTLEAFVSKNEASMFVHLQRLCGIVNPQRNKTETRKVYEMPDDKPADLWAKNQQPLWSSQIWDDARELKMTHQWVALTMLDSLKKNYPDLKEKYYRQLVAPHTGPNSSGNPDWVLIARMVEGAIQEEFQNYQMVKEIAKLRLKCDSPIMCRVRETNAPRLGWLDANDHLKSVSPRSIREVEDDSSFTRTSKLNSNVSRTSNQSPTPSQTHSRPHSNSNRPHSQSRPIHNKSPSHTQSRSGTPTHYQPQVPNVASTEAEAGKRIFQSGRRLPHNASKSFKTGYHNARRQSHANKSDNK